ncbi:hypothetical protein Tco_0600088 [Tanacetum coccineum]|uniref:Uncharacterized protein n=1 Tax=Tanacetum coccineum TaxID=301880 RepID=A0ABQ4WAT1_9ASTR
MGCRNSRWGSGFCTTWGVCFAVSGQPGPEYSTTRVSLVLLTANEGGLGYFGSATGGGVGCEASVVTEIVADSVVNYLDYLIVVFDQGVLGGDTGIGSIYSLNHCPGVLGGDTGIGSIYSLNHCPGVLGGDTCDGYIQVYVTAS